jgi:hypothetical protein
MGAAGTVTLPPPRNPASNVGGARFLRLTDVDGRTFSVEIGGTLPTHKMVMTVDRGNSQTTHERGRRRRWARPIAQDHSQITRYVSVIGRFTQQYLRKSAHRWLTLDLYKGAVLRRI